MQKRQISLTDLGLSARGGANPRITGLAVDSRLVRKGSLFAALPGTQVHGAHFIAAALDQGAGAILTDQAGADLARDAIGRGSAALVITAQPRAALARAAALFSGAPPHNMIAVTGTNGKTSVATFVRQIWQGLGLRAINLGTTGVEGDWSAPLMHTTPDPITLHAALAQAGAEGISHAAMEASSHGLDQFRLDGVELRAAGFTNFTHDHLDYHGSHEAYWRAKTQLFTRVLPPGATAVINLDDPKGAALADIAREHGRVVLGVGRAAQADLRIGAQQINARGQSVRLDYAGRSYMAQLDLIGEFQVDNAALAAALVFACGDAAVDDVMACLGELHTVRGRMQLVATRANGAQVFVDYAHTPDALARALDAMRCHVMGRLVAIIGAGGDRDPGKRVLMGQATAARADAIFVTDDNPRSESPGAIRAAIMQGCPHAIEVPDRAEAILRAVDSLGPGDALLIAGKGHESGQIIGDDVLPFNDSEQASIAVAALEGRLP